MHCLITVVRPGIKLANGKMEAAVYNMHFHHSTIADKCNDRWAAHQGTRLADWVLKRLSDITLKPCWKYAFKY